MVVRPTLGQGGADRMTATLLRRLPREHLRPTLVLMREEGEMLGELSPSIPTEILGAKRLSTAWLPLTRLVRRRRPDVLFSTSGGANLIAAVAHLLSGRTSRLVLSERNVLRLDLSWRKRLLAQAKRLLYPHADAITTVSAGIRDQLAGRLGLDRESISVVYNPVVDDDLDARASEPVGHPWFDDSIPIVLSAGRLVREKDQATLLQAFAQMLGQRPARLVVLGEGPLRRKLEALAVRLGIADATSFPGFDPNPFKYMARCSVFALSSRYEGLPGVLIQAMACGAAVVSTDCPSGPSEIVSNETDGLLVPVEEPQALAAALKRLLGDPDLRRRLGAKARESSLRFSAARSVPLYTEALLGREEHSRP